MTLKYIFITLFTISLFIRPSHSQCKSNLKQITIHYSNKIQQVCIKSYSIIKHCSSYWTSTTLTKYSTPTQFECSACSLRPAQTFFVNLVTSSSDPSGQYYLACIPNSQKVVNCQYYVQNVKQSQQTIYSCGACPYNYPVIVKGTNNMFSYCTDKQVSHCALYKQTGVDRYGYSKVKCDICQSSYNFDLTTNKCFFTIQNCQIYDSERKCSKCIQGYQLSNQTCYKVQGSPANSSSNNSSTNSSNNSSANSSNNSTTNSSSNLITPTGLIKNQSGCYQYNRRQGSVCIKCKQNNVLLNGSCYLCGQDFYINLNGQCSYGNFVNCYKFNSKGVCLSCKQGYIFSDDLSQCVSIKKKSICPQNTSKINYVYTSGSCVGVDVNCREGAYGVNGCYQCVIGFYNMDGVCYFLR